MLPLPLPSIPGIWGRSCHMFPRPGPLCSAKVRGSLLPAPGTSTLTQHPPQCHSAGQAPSLRVLPPLEPFPISFLMHPSLLFAFLTAVTTRGKFQSGTSPSPRGRERQHRSVPITAAPCPGASPPRSSGWWLLCFPSPSSCCSSPAPFLLEVRNLRLVWRCQRASGPPSADRSLCALLLPVFSVCLQPLEGSCDESRLDRIQQQLKRSSGWGWE